MYGHVETNCSVLNCLKIRDNYLIFFALFASVFNCLFMLRYYLMKELSAFIIRTKAGSCEKNQEGSSLCLLSTRGNM